MVKLAFKNHQSASNQDRPALSGFRKDMERPFPESEIIPESDIILERSNLTGKSLKFR